MATAIAQGAYRADPDAWNLTFFDTSYEKASRLAEEVNGYAAATLEDATVDTEIIVLAVRPQNQAELLQMLPPAPGALFLTIAAGRNLDTVAADLTFPGRQKQPAVLRAMPNVNALIDQAMTAYCYNSQVNDQQLSTAKRFLNTIGSTMELSEALFPTFTALAASSPAMFFELIEEMARAGVKHGLDKQRAMEAAVVAMRGSAAMLEDHLRKGGNATELVDRVCSPGGTSIAGLLAAQEKGLGSALRAGIDAVINKELELNDTL